jgi:hypothetical protein
VLNDELIALEAALRAPRPVHLKRKDGQGRMPFDFYETDYYTIGRCLGAIEKLGIVPARILDLGAGSGRWGEVARGVWPGAIIAGVEVREVEQPAYYDIWLTGSFPECMERIWLRYDLVIGNPPYVRSEPFIRSGLRVLSQNGHLGFLLKLSFLASQGRRDGLYQEFPPLEVNVCSKRPSFQENGGTNATEFGYYIWQKGYRGETRVRWL